MQDINLLPWRQKLITKQKRHFGIKCMFTLLVSISSFYIARSFLSNELQLQQMRNQRLTEEITKQSHLLKTYVKQNNKRKSLQKKLQFFHQLKNEQNCITILFNVLPEVIPLDVVLQKISMKNGAVIIEGRGRNNLSLTNMLSLLERHAEIQNVKMHSIVSLNNNGESQFKATFALNGFFKLNMEEYG